MALSFALYDEWGIKKGRVDPADLGFDDKLLVQNSGAGKNLVALVASDRLLQQHPKRATGEVGGDFQ